MSNIKSDYAPCLGLSFIDWESLDEEEFHKLDKIINTAGHGSGVQFPFLKELPPVKGVIQPTECTELSELSHDAPVFTSQLPPVVGYPMTPHWAAEPISSPCQSESPYPVTYPDGYVYHGSPQPVGCEAQIDYVAPFHNGQAVYAIPGHTMSPQFPPMLPVQPVHELSTMTPHLLQNKSPVTVPESGLPVAFTQPPPGLHMNQPVVFITQTSFMNCSGNGGLDTTPTDICLPQVSEPYVPQDSAPVDLSMKSPVQSNETNISVLQEKLETLKLNSEITDQKDDRIEYSEWKKTISDNNNIARETAADTVVADSVVADQIAADPVVAEVSVSETKVADANFSANSGVDDSEVVDNRVANKPIDNLAVTVEAKIEVPSKEPPQTKSPDQPPPQPAVKSWSSLFANKKTPSVPSTKTVESNKDKVVSQVTNSHVDTEAFPSIIDSKNEEVTEKWNKSGIPEKVSSIGVHNDPLAYRLLDQINDLQIVHTPIVIQPRGLKNASNTCFLNAPLQVLMGCPPFVHLFRSFKHLLYRKAGQSSTPILDSLVQFVNSFQNGQRINKNFGSRNKKNGPVDLNVGQAFIPEPV